MLKRMIAVAATLALTATAAMAAAESYTIGIGQFAEHGSLDNCRTGFLHVGSRQRIRQDSHGNIHAGGSLTSCVCDVRSAIARYVDIGRELFMHTGIR